MTDLCAFNQFSGISAFFEMVFHISHARPGNLSASQSFNAGHLHPGNSALEIPQPSKPSLQGFCLDHG